MNRIVTRLLFTLAFLFVCTWAGMGLKKGTAPKPALASASSEQTIAQGASTTTGNKAADSEEVVALRAQLELTQRYEDRILATVYWALGGIFTIAAVVTVLGWYSNFPLART